ncbi:MAG: carbohydrate esterase family protein [Halioglobus sp.]|nr:carbohydrate esterase family protein [Halioglobus sp.]|tara:strand:- start:954 stop:1937 length:984 start_codon:yes stop_codon:yes gene_type:complete
MSFVLDALSRIVPLALNTAGRQRLAILIYHRVVPAPDELRPGEPTVDEFDWQMRLLRDHFNPLSLAEGVQRLREGSLPPRAVCVTFDDGYADNERYAMTVLRRYGVPATVFVSTGFLNGGRMFNDTVIETVRTLDEPTLDLRDLELGVHSLATTQQRLAAIAEVLTAVRYMEPQERDARVAAIAALSRVPHEHLMMTDEQVRNLARNQVTVGAHTVNHPMLASVAGEDARREISDGKRYLENLLQQDVDYFAYPNGKPSTDYRLEHRDMVQALGFRAAVSTHWGVGCGDSDPYQLPRFTPWDRRPMRFALRLLLSYRRVDPLVSGGL